MFAGSDVVVLTRIDLIPLTEFDMSFFEESVRALNPGAPVFKLSCRTGEGIEVWADWPRAQHHQHVVKSEAS